MAASWHGVQTTTGTPANSAYRFRPMRGVRNRAAIALGLLLFLGVSSACSLISSGKDLPISIGGGSEGGVRPSACKLNASGTQAVATGTFNPPASPPNNVYGKPIQGQMVLSLEVVDVNGNTLGSIGGSVSDGQSSWQLTAEVRAGSDPTGCVVSLGI